MNAQRRNHSFATGVAMFVAAVLVTVSANAQPDRHSRNRVAPSASATMLAQQQTQTPSACTNPAGSDSQARAARAATQSGHPDQALPFWEEALRLCPSPDLYEGVARAYEALASLADDAHRLPSLEAELHALQQGLVLAETHPVQGYSVVTVRSRIAMLETAIENLQRQLARAVPQHVETHPVCTANTQTDVANCGACGHRCDAGLVCTAGACRALITTPPVVTPTPSRTAPLLMIVSGGALTIAGGTILGVGISARSAANADEATLARSGCNLPSRPTLCANYPTGATTPASIAAWAMPLGGVMLGVGLVDGVIGAVWYARTGRATTERPRLSGWYTPGGGGLSLTSTF